jgi:predicted glycosyltransferase
MLQPNILFFFETAAGLGHMRRTSGIVNKLVEKGAAVTVASGSFQSPQDFFDSRVKLMRLNPLVGRNGGSHYYFKEDGSKQEVVNYDKVAWQRERAKIVREKLKGQGFHAIIAEYWPFSRQVSFNRAIDEAIKATHKTGIHPLVFSSARDVLHTKNSTGKLTAQELEQEATALKVIKDKVDHILVHGDPRLFSFEQGFSEFDKIKKKVYYTGFVVTPIKQFAPEDRKKKVVVSVGSGTVGSRIISNIFNAHSHVKGLEQYEWVFIFGPRMSEAQKNSLKAMMDQYNSSAPASRKVLYYDYVPNLPELLGESEYSISMGGYNTTFEVMASGVKGIIVPKILKSKKDGNEFESCPEQAGRALQLEDQGFVSVIEFRDTNRPRTFAKLIKEKFDSAAGVSKADFSGAEKSAAFVLKQVTKRFSTLQMPVLPLEA